MERFYSGIGSAKVYGTAALVQGPRILVIGGIGVLCMEVLAKLAVPLDTAAQTLEIRKQVAANQMPPSSARYHVMVSGDWLSKIAKTYYGDMYKWPVIYEAMFVLPTKIKFASEETPTALRAAFAELVIALGPDRQEPVFLAEVLWSALHGLVVLAQSERIPATGAEVRLNVLVQKFSR